MIKLLKTLFSDDAKIIILGFGKEGKSTYGYIRKNFPHQNLGIADLNSAIGNQTDLKNDTHLEIITGKNYLDCLDNYDVIIKSPGVKIKKPSNDLISKITSQTDLFMQRYANQAVGVTGTKGKSTTSSLIKHFADADNKKALLLGNIGVPAFDMIDEIEDKTIIIYELSAHQLEYVHSSPHIAILLNVFPEHLDYFEDVNDYRKAKFNIFKYQNKDDIFIHHETYMKELFLFANELVQKNQSISQSLVTVSNKDYEFGIENNPLLGNHNLININIALSAAHYLDIDNGTSLKSLGSFKSLPHRLEHVGKYDGITFINDSISTVPQSTIAAAKALNKVDTLILGGFDRGLGYKDMVDYLIKSDINNFIFLGKAGDRMFKLFSNNKNKNLIKAVSIESAFSSIVKITCKDCICLLSPAAASYDQFHNFEHRGDVFKNLIKNHYDKNILS